MSDEWILKLAKNQRGIVQNEQEARYDYYKNRLGIFTRIDYNLSDTNNYSWLVSEYVLPAKERDFEECYGITFQEYEGVMYYALNENQPFFRRLMFAHRIPKQRVMEILEEHQDDFIGKIYDYVRQYGIRHGDLTFVQNLGLVQRNGKPEIVILDDGVTDEILKKYYS